jgi:hypothetical protein
MEFKVTPPRKLVFNELSLMKFWWHERRRSHIYHQLDTNGELLFFLLYEQNLVASVVY